jgi:alpha-tubulin suppressor-like RCC1 family protein
MTRVYRAESDRRRAIRNAVRMMRAVIAAGRRHSLGLRADGIVVAAGNNQHGQCDITGWDTIWSPN